MPNEDKENKQKELSSSAHGGRRTGAGRKKGNTQPKKQPRWRVSEEANNNIEKLAKETGHKEGEILNWLMLNPKKIPKEI